MIPWEEFMEAFWKRHPGLLREGAVSALPTPRKAISAPNTTIPAVQAKAFPLDAKERASGAEDEAWDAYEEGT